MNRKITIAAVTLAFLASCSTNPQFPQNPKRGEVYKDPSGSSWVWDAVMLRWALGGGSHYYYPNDNRYTNSSGVIVPPPHRHSSTYNSSNNSSSRSRAVFGSTGRSHSVSA